MIFLWHMKNSIAYQLFCVSLVSDADYTIIQIIFIL